MSGTVAVVGGGCSGALAARELLRQGDGRVVLIDPAREHGRGVAYGTAAEWHLLNAPAGAMSADHLDRDHFVAWCRRHGRETDAGDFVPRPVYGRYLAGVLPAADVAAPGRLTRRHARAVRVTPAGVVLDDGGMVAADHVVLALGQAPPVDPRGVTPGSDRYVGDPWAPGALDAVPDDGPVLLLGSGLTAVDVALTLTAAGPRPPIVAISRHGLIPQAHRTRVAGPAGAAAEPARPAVQPLLPVPPVLPSAALSDLVRAVRRLADGSPDWRTAVDSLRPHLDTLWLNLSPDARDRFVRHVARVWEVHRHRLAPPVAARLDELRACGALTVRAGRIDRVHPVDGVPPGRAGLAVAGRFADGEPLPRRFAAVVNCTGPGRLTLAGDPLVDGLVADGLARPGPLGLGLDTAADGALRDRHGRPSARLWTLGPPRRGSFWETTAVAEIRAQAHALAALIAASTPVRLSA